MKEDLDANYGNRKARTSNVKRKESIVEYLRFEQSLVFTKPTLFSYKKTFREPRTIIRFLQFFIAIAATAAIVTTFSGSYPTPYIQSSGVDFFCLAMILAIVTFYLHSLHQLVI
jgi:hypothetical protein